MSISLTKRNFLYQITLLTLIAGWVGAGILHYLLPGHYFGGYPFIPVYFFLFGLFEISMFDACRKHAPQKMFALSFIWFAFSLGEVIGSRLFSFT